MTSDLSSNAALPPTPLHVRVRLSIMMFLQYAIWGAWLPLMYLFVAFDRGFAPSLIGYLFMVGGVGALFGPFIAGQIADRYFNTEKFLAISHLLGAVLVWQLSWIESYSAFLLFALLYSLIYAPTLALTNSLAFHHLVDRDRDFGRVRLWGTIGWIVVGIGIGQYLLHYHTPAAATEEATLRAQAAGIANAFRLSAVLGIVMGIYCLLLPKTPPARNKGSNAAAKALAEAKRQPLLTLFLLAVPISCIHQFYFIHTSPFLATFQNRLASGINSIFGVGGGGLMTIGQISEVLVLALIPLVAKTLSRKTLLAIGVSAYAVRMALFAYVESISAATGIPEIAILVAGVALHGLCFGCFIFVAFMVVDENTAPDIRASAQNLFNLVIIGIGIIVGSVVAGYIGEWATEGTVTDYTRLFSVPMWVAVACLVFLLLFYPRHTARSAMGGTPCPRCGSTRVGTYCAHCGASVTDADDVAPAREVAR
jgi:nucleoside transporter